MECTSASFSTAAYTTPLHSLSGQSDHWEKDILHYNSMTWHHSQRANRVLCLTYKGLTKLANTMLCATESSVSVDNHPSPNGEKKKDIIQKEHWSPGKLYYSHFFNNFLRLPVACHISSRAEKWLFWQWTWEMQETQWARLEGGQPTHRRSQQWQWIHQKTLL